MEVILLKWGLALIALLAGGALVAGLLGWATLALTRAGDHVRRGIELLPGYFGHLPFGTHGLSGRGRLLRIFGFVGSVVSASAAAYGAHKGLYYVVGNGIALVMLTVGMFIAVFMIDTLIANMVSDRMKSRVMRLLLSGLIIGGALPAFSLHVFEEDIEAILSRGEAAQTAMLTAKHAESLSSPLAKERTLLMQKHTAEVAAAEADVRRAGGRVRRQVMSSSDRLVAEAQAKLDRLEASGASRREIRRAAAHLGAMRDRVAQVSVQAGTAATTAESAARRALADVRARHAEELAAMAEREKNLRREAMGADAEVLRRAYGGEKKSRSMAARFKALAIFIKEQTAAFAMTMASAVALYFVFDIFPILLVTARMREDENYVKYGEDAEEITRLQDTAERDALRFELEEVIAKAAAGGANRLKAVELDALDASLKLMEREVDLRKKQARLQKELAEALAEVQATEGSAGIEVAYDATLPNAEVMH